MFRNVMEFAEYHIDAYKNHINVFSQFGNLLENSEHYDINFKKDGENIVEFSLFGYPIEIFFTIFKSSLNAYPFSKVTISRHDFDKIDTFFSFYFDEQGNTLHEISGPYNSWNITQKESLRRIIALVIEAYLNKYLEKSKEED